ncbi:cell wall integrity and stress response component 3-like [Anneissia japonica]|uniref:cell wall integrity and stress response component 3-like n=1 Tax=Anneissia japonica TaxID=1529436 RepID=UPI001425646E|nr:cell wall integrity and stress response component 3-like [Anneissia japonica]
MTFIWWLFFCSLICVHFENSVAAASNATTEDLSNTDVTKNTTPSYPTNSSTRPTDFPENTTALTILINTIILSTNAYGETTSRETSSTTTEDTTVSTTSTSEEITPSKTDSMLTIVSEWNTEKSIEIDSRLSGGAIVGIVIGSGIFFCFIVSIVFIKLNTVTPASSHNNGHN